jgi:hypothetical protein
MSWYPNDCVVCDKPIEGEWESAIALGIETGELSDTNANHMLIYDKHIRCSPSRAQRIVHDKFPPVIDERPQFDWRPEADNLWTDEGRKKYKKIYTRAWLNLQFRTNPLWRGTTIERFKHGKD